MLRFHTQHICITLLLIIDVVMEILGRSFEHRVAGAPNVLKFAPGPRSIIRACDFDSQQDLADYLLYLDRNNTAYRWDACCRCA
jgi:hypothetical protein